LYKTAEKRGGGWKKQNVPCRTITRNVSYKDHTLLINIA